MEIAELVADVEDITDPSCMDKILAYLDHLENEDDEFMELLVNKLSGHVVLWPQPWYQRRTGLTRPIENLPEEEKQFRTDSFSTDERKLVAKNWKKLRKMFGLPNTPECFARWRNKNRSRHPQSEVEQVRNYVAAFLAQGLERNLYQVYHYFMANYGAPVKGPYSPIEERIMEICYLHYPDRAAHICATVLGREKRGINNKINILNNGEPFARKRVKWDLALATKLVKSLINHSGISLEKLKDANIDKSTWIKVQEDMDHNYCYLQRFWYSKLHAQLFVKCDLKLNSLRKKILKKLRSRYKVWMDIRWKDLLLLLPDGLTRRFISGALYTLVYDYPEGYLKSPLDDVIPYAFTRLKNIKKKRGEMRLKTLAMNEEGNLEYVRYDMPNEE